MGVPLKSMRYLQKDFEDALWWCLYESSSAMFADHRKFFYEDLVRYPIQKVVLLRSFEILLTCPGMRFWYEVLMSRQRCFLRHNKFVLLQFRQCLT